MEYRNKIVLVTGGAHGIGKTITEHFANAGAFVVCLDVNQAFGTAWQDSFTRHGLQGVFLLADVAKEEDVKHAIDYVLGHYHHIDILINNAGIFHQASLFDRTMEEFDRVLAVNLRGPYMMAKYAGQALREAKQGVIINIASSRALMSEANTEPYSASKGAIVALTHALAVSLGPEVRVNAISPGWIDVRETPIHSDRDRLQHPVGRVGQPDDIAAACLYLASPKASFITGINLVIDGGMTIKMIYEE